MSKSFLRTTSGLLLAAALLSAAASPLPAFRPSGDTYQPPHKNISLKSRSSKSAARDLSPEWGKFEKKYNGRWRMRQNKETGLPEALVGTKSERYAGTPETAAGSFLKDNAPLLGINTASVKVQKTLSHRGQNHLRYEQTYQGVHVENAETTVHLTGNNEVVAVYSRYRPDITIDVTPKISGAAALDIVKNRMALAAEPERQKKPELVVYPYGGDYYLAWKVRFFAKNPIGSWIHYVDAKTGEIVYGFNDLRFDTSGTVTGMIFPKNASNELRNEAFAYEYVCVNGSTVTTNVSGRYSSTASGAVVSHLEGPYATVINEDFSEVSRTDTSSSWTWNYTSGNTHFDEVNLFYHINAMHDYFKNTFGLTAMDYAIPATAHTGDHYDNAYYDPDDRSLYFGDGDGDFYRSFAQEAGIIYHEYAHGVQDHLYYLEYSGQSGAMMEAWSDYFSASILGDPLIGSYVGVTGCFRDISVLLQYPANWSGEVHADSVIYSGALWDLRKVLGRNLTDRIVFDAWYYQPYDFKTGLESMLMADDDDANLANGTPHETDIRAAFAPHGITTSGGPNDTLEEPNNDFMNDKDPLTSGTTVQPFIYSDGDQDYFKVFADTGVLSVELSSIPANCDYDLYLYDSQYQLLAQSVRSEGKDDAVSTHTVRGIYYIKVVSYEGSSTTQPYWLSATFTAAPADITQPVGLPTVPANEGDYGGSTLTFSWTRGNSADQQSGIAGYSVRISTTPGGSDGSDTFLDDVGSTLSKKITGCTNGKTYYAAVRAKNGAGLYGPWTADSDGIIVDTTPPAGVPAVPVPGTDLTNSTALTFSWSSGTVADAESGIKGYWLQVSTAPDDNVLNGIFDAYVGNVLAKNVYNCGDGTYYGRVRAVNGAGGYGAWSAWNSGTAVELSLISARITLSAASPLRTGEFQVTLAIESRYDISETPTLVYMVSDGAMIDVPLTGSNKSWTGTAYIESTTPEGAAVFSLAARDVQGHSHAVIVAGGTFAINTTLDVSSGGTVSNKDGTAVTVPVGASAENLHISITSPSGGMSPLLAANDKVADDKGVHRIRNLTMERQFSAKGAMSGGAVTSFTATLTIALPYPDANNDGIVDGTQLAAQNLRVFYLDESRGEWVLDPTSIVDTAAHVVTISSTHFSIYTVMSLAQPVSVSEVFAYPNPCFLKQDSFIRIANIPLDAKNVRVYVYTTALELVRTLEEGGDIEDQAYSKMARWDGKNDHNEKVASGVYLYFVHSDKGTKKEKIAVFW